MTPNGTRRRAALSAVAAVLLSLVLASQSMAATWTRVDIAIFDDDSRTGTLGWASGLATIAPTTAIALYQADNGIFVRRSTDSGGEWGEPLQLSAYDSPEFFSFPPHGRAAIASAGAHVDVVWVEDWQVRADAHVQYATSHDSGASFSPGVPLISPARGFPVDVAVARGPFDVVAVAWTRKYSGNYSVSVKVSIDGGQTFSPTTVLARGDLLRDVKIAVGSGVIYVAYVKSGNDGRYKLRATRSLDGGGTWASPVTVAGNLRSPDWYFHGAPSITALGSRAYVGFTGTVNGDERARYRATTDKGATWSSAIDLSSRPSAAPVLALQNGVLRAAFVECEEGCGQTSTIFYRRKPARSGWTTAEAFAVGAYGPVTAGVGHAGRAIVLWTLVPDYGSCCYRAGAYASLRTP